ncbi:MAG TPA: TMEM165/GDT1 family protein [Burkholderiales bacterium]|jgi:putative Ca2+/H+ antiporter (TMEM165/GDT1 family)|nr:TMEM165/GDT1 family protein [Burkholderiales bacterium]
MDAFLISTGIVALAEIGDKTQLLSLLLSARYQRPVPIIAGILIATVLNHALASAVGAWLTTALAPTTLRWMVGISFIAMALWILVPDRLGKDNTQTKTASRYGLLGLTLIVFFMAEMGDKTQIATIALAARFNAFSAVVAGTTVGMMVANVPVVLLGDRLAHRLPVRALRWLTMSLFAALGMFTLVGS